MAEGKLKEDNMAKEQEFNMDEIEDSDTEYIAEQIKEGYTSGYLDCEGGKRIYWEFKWNVWED
jgi:hypothetical protein